MLSVPKITWGSSFANTLNLGYPLDNATTYSENRDGSLYSMTPSGIEDAWIVGTNQILEGDLRWIPASDTTSPTATGWNTTTTGVRAFIEWARNKNIFHWYPDKTSGTYYSCYLTDPIAGPPTIEADGTRNIHVKLRTSDDSAFVGY